MTNCEASKQLIKEESDNRMVKAQEVHSSVGPPPERMAAEAELTNNSIKMGACHESVQEEQAALGRPLPMLCVWSQAEAEHYYKCRACVCGNFTEVDPTQEYWTARAEPSSLLFAIKLGRVKGWMMAEHDVKGASLNAKMPEGTIVAVSPPEQ